MTPYRQGLIDTLVAKIGEVIKTLGPIIAM